MLGLLNDLVDAGAQSIVGGAEGLFRRQQRNCGSAAGRIFHNLVGRAEPEAICLVSMQTRQVQIIVTRNLGDRLATREATVDLRALNALAGANSVS